MQLVFAIMLAFAFVMIVHDIMGGADDDTLD